MPPRYSRFAVSVAVACAAIISSCRSFTEPDSGINAEPRVEGVLITNRTSAPITYMVYDPTSPEMALVDPCYDRCPTIGAGDQGLVPWTSVLGYDQRQRRYTVSWHQLGPAPQVGELAVFVPLFVPLP
jgi:hypothetical protein